MIKRPEMMLCLTHLVGNALLLLLGYYWLGLGEEDAAHLAFSAAMILFLVLAAIWLHGTALVVFRRDEPASLRDATVRAFRNLLPLLLLSAALLLGYAGLRYFYYSFGHEAFTIGSYTTMKLRRPVEPNNVLTAFRGFIWLLEWFVVPVLAFPLASEVARKGWSGFNLGAFRRSKKIVFWLEAGLLCMVSIYLPLHLFFWVPKMPNFALEVVSVTARLGLGYLLFTGGFLMLEFLSSAGSPRVSQVSTVVSP